MHGKKSSEKTRLQNYKAWFENTYSVIVENMDSLNPIV